MVDQVNEQEQTEQELRNLATQDGVTDAAPVEESTVDGILGEDDVATETETEQPEQTETAVEESAAATETDQEGTGEPKQVPLAALHEERDKYRTLRDDPEALERRLMELRGQAAPAPVQTAQPAQQSETAKAPEWGKSDPNDPDPRTLVEADDVDIMSNSELMDHQEKCKAFDRREETRHQRIADEMQNQRIDTDGRQRFTAKTMGEGLDYDTVLKTGSLHLSPADVDYIKRSPNQAKAAYDLCIERCPALKFMKANSGKTPANNTPNATVVQTQTQSSSEDTEQIEESPPNTIDANDRTVASVVDALDI
jgi:hypothetical protein